MALNSIQSISMHIAYFLILANTLLHRQVRYYSHLIMEKLRLKILKLLVKVYHSFHYMGNYWSKVCAGPSQC